MSDSDDRPLEVWLPALERFSPAHPLQALLARADRLDNGPAGYMQGLDGYFEAGVSPLPVAALTRELLASDAGTATWLCADPAWVQPDMSGARLLACGRMPLSMDEAVAFADALQPVFEEAGMRLEVSTADRWHVRLPQGLDLPVFASPEQALGEDLYTHLPQGSEGRRWRVLFNEAQVLLHQHPLQSVRAAHGLPPVNSLWLWGAGVLPARVRTSLAGVIGDDLLLQSLAKQAGVPHAGRTPEALAAAAAGWLVDLQDLPVDEIASGMATALQAQARRQPVRLAFASGERWLHRPSHRLRFWRRTRQ
ncbi:phosphoglycerate mutase [Dyella sp. A6]|uniref:phosphoglycerate mutase n=1 Tax=Dyella aluminiiresistens TaxID=3069105 RepID=UPI002E786E6D|nr:phosphoglycerate mutase [Dyella sp. A6]